MHKYFSLANGLAFSFLGIRLSVDLYLTNKGSIQIQGHISLEVPKVEFDFEVSIDSMQLLTHTSKSYHLICTLR